MIGMPEGFRTLLVAYDVEGYGGRGKRLEVATQQRLVDVLKYAFGEARVPADGYKLQEQGDGGLALLRTGHGVDEPRVITTLIDALDAGLAEINEDLVAKARIRLRVALHEGVVHRAAHGFAGPAVTEVCRLRDAATVKQMLADSSGNLVVVVDDHLYRDVLADTLRRTFVRAEVTAKEFAATAWIFLPGGPGGSGRPGGPGGPEDTGRPRRPGRIGDVGSSASGSLAPPKLGDALKSPDPW